MAKASDVMNPGVNSVAPDATVQEAATQMAELDVGALFVGSDEALEGVLTDRDIIVRLVVEGRSSADAKVSEIMSAALFSCKADDPVEAVFAEMRERQIRRMPVYDESGSAVGVVALSDLAKAVRSPEQIHETLREISEPHRSRKATPAEETKEPEQEGAESPPDAAATRT